MNTGEALLRAILTNPDEDTVRVEYADWLQENGEPERAEFIRVQIEAVRFCEPLEATSPYNRDSADEVRRQELRRRERELEYAHGQKWFPPIGGVLAYVAPTFRAGVPHQAVRRGFVESVTCTAAAWLEHGPALAARHPVTAVTLSDRGPVRLGNGSYRWSRGGWDLFQYGLWPELYDCLPHPPYRTRGYALAVLSGGCVNWARGAAGLPVLSFP